MDYRVSILTNTLSNIASSIRDMGGAAGPLSPTNMPAAIRNISGGGEFDYANSITLTLVPGTSSSYDMRIGSNITKIRYAAAYKNINCKNSTLLIPDHVTDINGAFYYMAPVDGTKSPATKGDLNIIVGNGAYDVKSAFRELYSYTYINNCNIDFYGSERIQVLTDCFYYDKITSINFYKPFKNLYLADNMFRYEYHMDDVLGWTINNFDYLFCSERSNVSYMDFMRDRYGFCGNIPILKRVSYINNAFINCRNLRGVPYLYSGSFDNSDKCFMNCYNLSGTPLFGYWDKPNYFNLSNIFVNTNNLKGAFVVSLDSSVQNFYYTNFYGMFNNSTIDSVYFNTDVPLYNRSLANIENTRTDRRLNYIFDNAALYASFIGNTYCPGGTVTADPTLSVVGDTVNLTFYDYNKTLLEDLNIELKVIQGSYNISRNRYCYLVEPMAQPLNRDYLYNRMMGIE